MLEDDDYWTEQEAMIGEELVKTGCSCPSCLHDETVDPLHETALA